MKNEQQQYILNTTFNLYMIQLKISFVFNLKVE